ncbi:MAG: hypothetical protein GEU83_05335 [Pseudonocardiaceae bacterium]|nr:hypothetical protein [Pseudonocardiaceae bacterium]
MALPLAALLSLGAAQPTAPARPVCTPPQPELAELSGLATDGQQWFAVSDGGQRLEVFVLDPATCAIDDVITADVNPYDVEDLALGSDGALWLADTGDNDRDRETVALHRLTPEGEATLFRLVYPDGPHDAEALLLDRAGVPHIVTKEVLGPAAVYRPEGPLRAPGPTSLQRVASVRLGPTDTPGGPAGEVGSALVTGAAMSGDGSVLALRTYSDAYLYAVPDGDVVAALGRAPVRIALPGEPQGEAVALAPDGTLLSGSEGGVPIRAMPAATAPLSSQPAPHAVDTPDRAQGESATGDDGFVPWPAAALTAALATIVVAFGVRRRRS